MVTAVLFAGQMLQEMDGTQELGVQYLWTLLPALLPVAASYAAPFAFLIAVAFTFARMVSDREIAALRIAGVHPRVVVAPVVAAGAVLALVCLASGGWWIPRAKQEFNRQRGNLTDVFLAALSGSPEPVALRQCRLSYAGYVPASDRGGAGTFLEFELDQRDRQGNLRSKILGEKGRLERDGDDLRLETDRAWVLYEDESRGGQQGVDVGPRSVNVGHVESLGTSTAFNEFVGGQAYERKAPDVELPDLWYMVARGDLDRVPRVRSLVELNWRLATAFSPFVFGLMAVAVSLLMPVGARRLVAVFLAFLPAVVVHFPLVVAGKSLADSGTVPAWAGIWGPNAVVLAGALLLLRRAYAR